MSYFHRQFKERFKENEFWSKVSVRDAMCVVSIILSVFTIITIIIYLGISSNVLVESSENKDLTKTLTAEELLSKESTTNTTTSEIFTTETTTSTTLTMTTTSTTSTEESTSTTETTTVTELNSTTTSKQMQTTKQVETKLTTTSQTVTTVATTTVIPETESIVTEDYVEEWTGPILTRSAGTIQGPSGKETYYNLDMSGVVSAMRAKGYDYEYWVRDDGVKMFGSYVMCAANLEIRPKGTLVQTSLGMAIVCDTGGFAHRNTTHIDIAVNW